MRKKKGKIGWMALKIDLEKAYDIFEWKFVHETLVELNIPIALINLIMHCVTSVSTQVLWNGSVFETFNPSRGIRQGDLLSPYLFVLCMERPTHAIQGGIELGAWKPIKLSRNEPQLSHLFFANDLVIFAETSLEQVDMVKQVFVDFCASSGQKVSAAKSRIFFSANVPNGARDMICHRLGYEEVDNLGMYLGVPLIHKRVTKVTHGYLIQKVRSKLSGWKAKNLSLAGRIILAKSVLSSILAYTMQFVLLPINVCNEIEGLIRRFLWGGSDERKGVSLVNWEEVCKPTTKGGLGIRQVFAQNKTFLMKVAFNLVTRPDCLWVQVLRSKYKWPQDLPNSIYQHGSSRLWQGLGKIWEEVK
ncbi:hypothetical protein HRI_002984600 [Hibiscus trionum]|uniref:Reverse transcriptase domain-containing protein n=1 Tax=Hibiscus trionum TaxID=183268 RepID=A0A9W7M9G9_HIBTR|nr:hypothetical protein HRI_002984600 [Hibiscus trionum]